MESAGDKLHGYKPLRAFVWCLPGGAWFTVGMGIFGTLTHLKNAFSLCKSGDPIFGIVVLLGTCLTGACIFVVMFGTGYLDPRGIKRMVHDSVRAGVPNEALAAWQIAKGQIEGPICGLVAGYAFTLQPGLGMLAAASATVGLLLAAKDGAGAMKAAMLYAVHEGDDTAKDCVRPAVIGDVLPTTALFVSVFSIVQVMSEYGLFAVCSRVLHPTVTLAAFAIGAEVHAVAEGKRSEFSEFLAAMLVPTYQFCLLPVPLESTCPSRPKAIFVMLRVVILVVLGCSLELPEGICPLGTLNREMGASVWRTEFVQPVLQLMKGELEDLTETTGMTIGSATYHALLVGIVAVLVPLYLFMILGLLLSGKLNCDADHRLKEEVEAKCGEVLEALRSRRSQLEEQGALDKALLA